MRIVALGGAGDMGSHAVRDLARQDDVEEILIADYDEEKASLLAKDLGGKCQAIKVDAEKPGDLVRVMEGFDVAAGAIGPFYKYEYKVARAAVDAGVSYVSICDDYDAAGEVFKLDAEAKSKGVTVLTGLGWTPGLSNVLARKGAENLDEVEEIAVAWAGSASDSEGYAVILHTIHIFTGYVPSFVNGRVKMVKAGSERERILFPKPVGEVYVYNLGHPEPVTIPRFVSARTVTLKGGLSEDELNRTAIWLARLRLTTTPGRKDRTGKIIKFMLPVLSRIGRPEHPCSAIRVDVTGKRKGDWAHFTYGAADHMNNLTGIPLAVGALMIGSGRIDASGVQAPEGCVDPDQFLAELGKRNIKVFEGESFEVPVN